LPATKPTVDCIVVSPVAPDDSPAPGEKSPGDRGPSLLPRARLLVWGILAALLAHPAAADIVSFSKRGYAELQKNHLIEVQLRRDGLLWFVQGRIIVPRDETDQPILPNPRRYFMFRPFKAAFTPTGLDGNPKPDAKEVRLDFNWIGGMNLELDTLDDVRAIISNRDLRYANGAEALDALLADIDPEGVLHLKASTPAVANDKIVPREGYLSQVLIHGNLTPSERADSVKRLRAMPFEDPLSYNPLDPLVRQVSPADTMLQLLRAMARCDKWGEEEPGLRATCAAIAHFIGDTICVEPSEVPEGARETANRIHAIAFDARRLLYTCVENVSPRVLARAPAPGATAGWKPVTQPDDAQPLYPPDLARAALEILATMRIPRAADCAWQLDALVACAANRADLRGSAPATRPEFTADAAEMGQKAFQVLLQLAAAPTDGTPDHGAYFRLRLLERWLLQSADPANAEAARELLVRAGMAGDPEIAQTLDYLFGCAENVRGEADTGRRQIISVLRRLPASIADAALRHRFQMERDLRIQQAHDDVKSGFRGEATRRFLELYDVAP
jgi:hypothetical protein